MSVGGSIANAAGLVGIPDTLARRSIHALHNWARNRTDPGEFETALRQLADELGSASHLIDYQRRREALRYWCVEPATWRQLINRVGRSPVGQMGGGDHKRQAASIFVWARVTQGEYLLAPRPILDQLPRDVHKAWQPTLSHSYRALLAEQGGPAVWRLRVMLDEYADTLAASIDRGDFRS